MSINEDAVVEVSPSLEFLSEYPKEFQNSGKWEPLKSTPSKEVSMDNHADSSLGIFSKYPF